MDPTPSLVSLLSQSWTKNENQVFLIEAATGKSYTYNQFFLDALCFSHYLNTTFHNANVILISGRNNYRFCVFLLGTMLSGKTLMPINPEENPKTLSVLTAMISKSYLLLKESEQLELEKLRIDYFNEKMTPHVNPELIYIPTSATTGLSKIVIQSEVAIVSNYLSLITHHKLNSKKTIGTPLPLFHVNALHFSFLATLVSGGKLVLFDDFDLKKLFESTQKYGINILSIIPSILNSIIRNSQTLSQYKLDSLEYFVSAAAPLSIQTSKDVLEIYNKKVIQGYGLSEAVNFSTTLPTNLTSKEYASLMINSKFPSIGISLSCNNLKIVRENGSECQESEEGEILIKGKNLMNGYLNTNEDSFSNEGYFPTGDLGYYKNFKSIQFYFISGRKKEIAKINGESVALREIDEFFYQFKKISNDCFVTSFENDYRGEELALICQFQKSDDIKILFENLQATIEKLDLNRAPRVILFSHKELIRTPSGKAKRWHFKQQFAEYKEIRFFKKIYLKVI